MRAHSGTVSNLALIHEKTLTCDWSSYRSAVWKTTEDTVVAAICERNMSTKCWVIQCVTFSLNETYTQLSAHTFSLNTFSHAEYVNIYLHGPKHFYFL